MPSPSSSAAAASASASASASTSDDNYIPDSGESGVKLSRPNAERCTSVLVTKDKVATICKKYAVPKEFIALPAGDKHACSSPPPGAVCVYQHALAAGMRVPLHPFFCEVLRHFGLAPSQIMPNGWRIIAGFLVLSHRAGVPPSLAVFRHFFSLALWKLNGWYFFKPRKGDASRKIFTGLPDSIKGWKRRFFFLSSPAPWPCPVRWGEPPSETSKAEPALTAVEKNLLAKLLGAHGSTPVDLRTHLCESNLAVALSSNLNGASPTPRPPPPPPPPPPSSSPCPTKEMVEPMVYEMMKSMRAEKAAAQSSATGKKRKLEEANPTQGSSGSHELTTPTPHGDSVSCPSVPPGFSTQTPPMPDRHDGDAADSWEAARQLLRGIVTPSRERVFSAANPSDVVAASYVAMLQAANYATFSFGRVLKLDERLRARERDAVAEAGALRAELEKAKSELAAAKKATASEAKNERAMAVKEYLGSGEHKTQLAEHALMGCERGLKDMKRVALRLYPNIDPARLVVPPGGPS